MGLREEKKERIREQLMDVAMKFFTEKGFEQTTIDDIVSEAGVSRRTFFRYFETKEDVAIAWKLDDDFEGLDKQFAEALAMQEPGEYPFTALRQFLESAICKHEEQPGFTEIMNKIEGLIARTPALQARRRAQIGQFAQTVNTELAQRWGMDPEHDLLPRLMTNCAMAIVESAFDTWAARGGSEGRAELVDQAFAMFEAQFALLTDTAKDSPSPQKAQERGQRKHSRDDQAKRSGRR